MMVFDELKRIPTHPILRLNHHNNGNTLLSQPIRHFNPQHIPSCLDFSNIDSSCSDLAEVEIWPTFSAAISFCSKRT